MRIIALTLICSPADDAMDAKSKKQIMADVKKHLEKQIPKGHRCSLVIGVKNEPK